MSRRWTAEDDAYLIQWHGQKSCEEIGRELGRTVGGVRNRAYLLGIGKARPWGSDELSIVRAAYEGAGTRRLDLNALVNRLGRGRSEICRKAREMGLTDHTRMKTENGPKDRRKFKGDKAALSEHISKTTKKWIAENGHPKGMKGKRHSLETREQIGKISAQKWRDMTKKEREAHTAKAVATRKAKGFEPPKTARGTWRAGWREIGDKRHYFRSRWEANYARYLQWLKDLGHIKDWEYEPKTFWFDAIKRGVRSYKPDFFVHENSGTIVIHEVKGWMDSRSRTTLKRMAKYYPEETVVVIDGDQYRAIRRKVMGLIPGWEDHARDNHK